MASLRSAAITATTALGVAVLQTWPRKPRDKAKVEVGVQIVERWILARLRHRTFFGLAELATEIERLTGDLNARVMRHLGVSRRELFEKTDRPALRPFPQTRTNTPSGAAPASASTITSRSMPDSTPCPTGC